MSFGNSLTLLRPGVGVSVGVVGPKGDDGAPGPQGAQGNNGLQGLQGVQGLQGQTGPAPFTPLALWVTSTYYSANAPASYVSTGGSSYVCVVGHTSGASFAADLAAGYWQIVASKGDVGPTGATGGMGPAGPTGNGSGNVVGPASSTDGHIALFDGPTGTKLKDGIDPATLATTTALSALAASLPTRGQIVALALGSPL